MITVCITVCWIESENTSDWDYHRFRILDNIKDAINLFLDKSNYMPSFYCDLAILDLVEYSWDEILDKLVELEQIM